MLLQLSNFLIRFIRPINSLCLKIATVCASIMVLVVSVNVVSRYIFHYSFASAEEVARFMMIWFTFLLLPTIQEKGQNICVDFFVSSFRYTRKGMLLAIVTEICIIVIFCFSFYHGLLYIDRAWKVISPGAQIRMGYIFLVLPFSFTLSTICCVERLMRFIHYFFHADQIQDLRAREIKDLGIEESA